MLPQLLYIIGGTNVRASYPNARATSQPSAPEPNAISTPAAISTPLPAISNSFPASAVNTSSGLNTSMLTRLTAVMSDLTEMPRMHA